MQNRPFLLNLGPAKKSFQTSKYSLERSFQKDKGYQKKTKKKKIILKFFRKTLRSNLKTISE